LEAETMNWDQMSGRWKNVKGKVREKWGKLTDDDLDVINGKREQLVGTIQRRYGETRENAEKQVKQWEEQISDALDTVEEESMDRSTARPYGSSSRESFGSEGSSGSQGGSTGGKNPGSPGGQSGWSGGKRKGSDR
jgi:uncharacterized protein YjbJ (UPF0337 family)